MLLEARKVSEVHVSFPPIADIWARRQFMPMSPVRPARICSIVALIVNFGGWLTMKRAEAAILSTNPRTCQVYATVLMRGYEDVTCSFLAARYHAGLSAFAFSWLVFLASIVAMKINREG